MEGLEVVADMVNEMGLIKNQYFLGEDDFLVKTGQKATDKRDKTIQIKQPSIHYESADT